MKRTVCILLCLVLLTGCSPRDEAYTPTGDGLTWEDDYTGPVYTRPPEEEQKLLLTYYPQETMNPYRCTDFTNRALFTLLYQGLFSVDRDYKAEPVLCKSYKVSQDMKTYTFYLQPARFSDGELLLPQDVVDSLQAAKENKYYEGRFTYVREIALSEDGGVTVRMDIPFENLPLLLDVPIVKSEEVESVYPLGTGPYVLSRTAVDAVLHRQRDWWCQAELPMDAETIALMEAKSVTQVRDAFEFKGLSLVCADPGSDRYADYRCDFELWDCETGEFVYLTVCQASKVFESPEMRKNLTYAIDRERIAKEFYRGFARAASLPASPLSPFYSQTLASAYQYDSMRFAQAVKDADMRDQPVVLLVNSGDSLRVRVARAIGEMLEDCGLQVQMKEVTGNAYIMALKNWDFDLHLGQTKLSPNMDLTQFYGENGVLSWGGVNNVTLYALCQQALENHGNYYTLHKTLMDQGGLCPVVFGSYAVFATRGLLTGLTPSRDSVFYYSMGTSMEQARIPEETLESPS